MCLPMCIRYLQSVATVGMPRSQSTAPLPPALLTGTTGVAQQEEEGGEGGRPRRRWGQHATVAAENTQLYLLAPKTDVHGLGFDPFKVRAHWQALSYWEIGNWVAALLRLPAGWAVMNGVVAAGADEHAMRSGTRAYLLDVPCACAHCLGLPTPLPRAPKTFGA